MGGVPPRLYVMGRLAIQLGRPNGYWHISVSHPERDPTWEEIKHVQNELKPGVFFAMPMPPKEWWMSIAKRCYHLFEVKDEVLIRMWKASGEMARRYPEGTTLGEALAGEARRGERAAVHEAPPDAVGRGPGSTREAERRAYDEGVSAGGNAGANPYEPRSVESDPWEGGPYDAHADATGRTF
jgi:hypothetical protein